MHSKFVLPMMVVLAFHGAWCVAEEAIPDDVRSLWDRTILEKVPETWPAPDYTKDAHKQGGPEVEVTGEGVRGLFYEGLPWKGKPTRVFAWYAAPEHAPGEKLPAMVLAHGGGGTAFDEWVRIWNKRGYAAIAMDLTGTHPGGVPGERPRHEWGGPPNATMSDIDQPFRDQWVYHAVADVALAHSLIRSYPEIDPARIGMMGISWGGFLAALVSAVDSRFAFAVPVYGAGFFNEAPVWAQAHAAMGPERVAKWHRLWDPAQYVPHTGIPTLWLNNANDPFFPLSVYGKTFAICGGTPTLSIHPGMAHGHVPPWETEEPYAYADSFCRGGKPLARITGSGLNGSEAWVTFEASVPVKQVDFIQADDIRDWISAPWETSAATVDAHAGRATAVLTPATKAWFFNVVDERGLIVSTNRAVVEATVQYSVNTSK